MNQDNLNTIIGYIQSSPFHLQVLQKVRELNLPDWAIGAGFVRNRIWDCLHDFKTATPLNDIDVIFYDAKNFTTKYDAGIEKELVSSSPKIKWSVRNQARMHERNNDRQYQSTENAMQHWLETPTCIAVRLEKNDLLSIMAPFGIDDLMNLKIRPTPAGIRKPDEYSQRINIKKWLSLWPKLKVVEA